MAAGPLFLAFLLLEAWLRFKGMQGGISGFIAQSFTLGPIRKFGVGYFLRIILPAYAVGGIFTWLLALFPGVLARPTWLKDWRGREALGFGLSGLLWVHVLLWWQVPSALWVLPGLRALPFWALFPLLGLLSMAYPMVWLHHTQRAPFLRAASTLAAMLLAWSLLILAPAWIPRFRPAARPGNQECKVLMLGIDGLRSDTFLENAGDLKGLRYRNTYTVIPATRLLWHILWGGDPMTFTIGHVGASKEEVMDPHGLKLLKAATDQGWKPRFYMDDGGTISLAGRQMDLDDSLMPAAGWENFVNSNLAVEFPLYAVWENWLKPFPTTNPWAPLDAGLRETLRLGRGSAWVMFHTCLAHQPIFLHRDEMAQLGPRWWTLRPRAMEPKSHIALVTQADVDRVDPRTSPFLVYQTRMRSILRAWEPIWNGLDQDPAYRGAARFLFSDHGERFHHLTNDFQLQGVHGYSLDPWEVRATLLATGPGFSDQVVTTPRDATVSLLGLVRGVDRLLDRRGPFDSAFLEKADAVAPMRYHTVTSDAFGPEPYPFRSEAEKDLVGHALIGNDGMWFMEYKRSATERAKDASIAWAEGSVLHTVHPLVGGGAREFIYDGYEQTQDKALTEEEFHKVKARVETMLSDPSLRP
jgi:hypothetical protein